MKPSSKNLQTVRGYALRIAGGIGLVSIAAWSAPALSASPALAEISVNIGVEGPPPPPRHEVIIASPGPDFVWVGGFWDGAPGHYVWTAGHWERPPHGRGAWIAPHWERDNNGHYHQVKGEWRDRR